MTNLQFKTSIKKARGLGSAHSGSHHWLQQRISAVALLILSFWFVVNLAISFSLDYTDFFLYWSFPLRNILAVLTIFVALYHAVLGIQIIAEDYIQHHGWRFFVIIFAKFLAVILASFFLYGSILLIGLV